MTDKWQAGDRVTVNGYCGRPPFAATVLPTAEHRTRIAVRPDTDKDGAVSVLKSSLTRY